MYTGALLHGAHCRTSAQTYEAESAKCYFLVTIVTSNTLSGKCLIRVHVTELAEELFVFVLSNSLTAEMRSKTLQLIP